MALHGAQHFLVVAVIRCKEVGADEQQDDVVILDMFADPGVQFLTGSDPAIMPSLDDALPLQHCQLGFELVAQDLIFVRI